MGGVTRVNWGSNWVVGGSEEVGRSTKVTRGGDVGVGSQEGLKKSLVLCGVGKDRVPEGVLRLACELWGLCC